MEAAAHVVVQAALGHLAQRERGHLDRRGAGCGGHALDRRHPEQEVEHRRARKLRGPAKPALTGVKRLLQLLKATVERRAHGGGRFRVLRSKFRVGTLRPSAAPVGAQGFRHPLALRDEFLPILRPRLRERTEERGEARPAPPILGRKIGAAEKRLEVGGQPHAQRPAALAGRGLHVGHVDAVDVGPLLAVDLHRHEVAVELPGDGLVLERFVRHHMTPVAGRIADGEEDRLLLRARLRKGLVAPRLPVDRIVGVLAQVGRLLTGETVGEAGRCNVGHWQTLAQIPPDAKCQRGLRLGRRLRDGARF